MFRRPFLIILPVLISLLLAGCSTADTTTMTTEKIKPVEIMEVNEETYSITLDYLGLVESGVLKKYSFKSAGKIEEVYVTKGDKIRKGDKLARLNTEDLNYALQAAKAQLDSAQAQYDSGVNGATVQQINQAALNVKKAEEAYNFAQKNYDSLTELYNKNEISKQDLEKAELEMNLRKADLDIAKEIEAEAKQGISNETEKMLLAQVEAARINYEQKKSMVDSATIISDIDGYVVDVLNKEGEIVNSGYPVVIVSNDNPVVTVGASQKDIDKIQIGQKAIVTVNEKEYLGTVSSIGALPDMQTRTYNIDIELEENSLRVGTITDVTIILEEKTGILIPLNSIMKNGETYVYVIENGIAKKKTIELGDTIGANIVVNGLRNGDKLIINGFKDMTEGDKVVVKP